ncbi:plastocyanin/azurin family copper-binding protein [Halolamina litorea]|uniref:Plastocyanin/azurin family copper-binding protein n=1 Tax=Halolamina litorea TaxID=1515593 RepID=A0ABD6BQ78_9EURY|nr:plastocyanin/azurin family copper-binding protein [Halolamina litorea]
MKRRDFLRATGGSGGAVAIGSGVAAGQESTGTDTGSGGGGSGPTETVTVGPGGSLVFEPAELTIATGTTVNFVWDSNTHNVVPTSQPEGADWAGEGEQGVTFDSGHEYSYTFTTTGAYEYVCTPHESAGMVGSIEVVEELEAAGGGGERELHDIGAPIHPHWVGVGTILMMFVSLVFTFYILKYGESPNTGNTGGGE